MPPKRNIAEFETRVKSVLWRQDTNKEKPTYHAWKSKVAFLRSKEGPGYNKSQAMVQAAKDHKCLYQILREYDLREFDPNPDSHPNVVYGSDCQSDDTLAGITCENKQQDYRESLQWAIQAAGRYARTGEKPRTCPCDAAYYLYEQARDNPKDFLGRIGQIESKGVGDSEDDKNLKREGKRTVKYLEGMIRELLDDDK